MRMLQVFLILPLVSARTWVDVVDTTIYAQALEDPSRELMRMWEEANSHLEDDQGSPPLPPTSTPVANIVESPTSTAPTTSAPSQLPTPELSASLPHSLITCDEEMSLPHIIRMHDSWGDGWNGVKLTIRSMLSSVYTQRPGHRLVFEGTLRDGHDAESYVCLSSQVCYSVDVGGDEQWLEEIKWDIRAMDLESSGDGSVDEIVTFAKGKAPSSCQFSVPSKETGDFVCPFSCLTPSPAPTLSPTQKPSTREITQPPTVVVLGGSTQKPKYDSMKGGSTETPTYDSTMRGSTETPTYDSTMRGSTDTPTYDSTMEGSTEIPTYDSTIGESTETPTYDSTMGESTETPTNDSTMGESTEIPSYDSTLEESTNNPASVSFPQKNGVAQDSPNREINPPEKAHSPSEAPTRADPNTNKAELSAVFSSAVSEFPSMSPSVLRPTLTPTGGHVVLSDELSLPQTHGVASQSEPLQNEKVLNATPMISQKPTFGPTARPSSDPTPIPTPRPSSKPTRVPSLSPIIPPRATPRPTIHSNSYGSFFFKFQQMIGDNDDKELPSDYPSLAPSVARNI